MRPQPPPTPAHLRGVLQELDRERRTLFLAGIVGECLPSLTRLHGLAGDWHQIAFSALRSEDVDQVITEQVAHYRRLRVAVEWAVYAHDEPKDLVERLQRHGFDVGPREAVVVLDSARRPSWLTEPCPFHIERVHTAEQLSAFSAAAEQIFGTDQTPVVRELDARLAESSTEHVAYVAYAEGAVASVARLYTHPASQFAGLYGGGTVQRQRGRGLYRALVRQRALDAIASGARYLRVDALPTSQPILERLGFEIMTYVWPCVLEPPVLHR